MIAPAMLMVLCSLCACDPGNGGKNGKEPGELPKAGPDVPLLPVSKGDAWIYQVRLEIPEGVSSAGAAAVNTSHRRVRTYLGKAAAAAGLPETDCFEVEVPGAAREREFVDIHPDRILMRGSLVMRDENTPPLWLETPVPFVVAGMKPGTTLPEIRTAAGGLTRTTKVIAREDLTVPAGTFPCIRLVTTGNDGEVELRRTIWFSPGNGIIREEKTRYRRDKLLFREAQELVELRRS
jgi:hypothetical protein